MRLIPIEIHDVHQRWIAYSRTEWRVGGLLTQAEDKLLDIGVGTSTLIY